MSTPSASPSGKAVDQAQQRLASYAREIDFAKFPPEVIHEAKIRLIDTLGALVGGFFAEPCRIARDVAAEMQQDEGVSIIGTRMKTTPDLAAFVNATTARFVEMTDFYHWPGSSEGHPSDVLMPLLAAGEAAGSSGRDFITGIVLAYEVYQRTSDGFRNPGFDHTNFALLGAAVAAGRLFGLSAEQLSHCISMAIVPNNTLRQVRTGHLSMFKAAASGQAGRAALFAAMLAREGMEGPHLPFEGKAGWFDHVAKARFAYDALGGGSTRYKILDAGIKWRPSVGNTISSILAAEKVAPVNIKDVSKVTLELYRRAVERVGSGDHVWNPQTRETADHSAPYVVAVTLMDGTVTPRSFNDAHLANADLRALLQKIQVVENDEFTRAFARVPPEHRARVTVTLRDGRQLVGEAGGEGDGGGAERDARIEAKFRGLCEDTFGAKRVASILDRLWHLEDMKSVAEIPPLFTLA